MTSNQTTAPSQEALSEGGSRNMPSQVGLVIVNSEGQVVLFNSAAEQLLGFASHEMIDEPLVALVSEDYRAEFADVLAMCFGESETLPATIGRDLTLLHKSGREVPVVVGFTVVTSSGVADTKQLLMDISEVPASPGLNSILQEEPTPQSNEQLRKLNEDLKCLISQLQESEQKYRILYEGSPVMHANVDPQDATIKNCNQLLVDRLGYSSKNEILGKSLYEVYHESCHEEVLKAFQHFVEEGRVDNVELSLKCSDGCGLPVILNVAAVRDEQGKILYSSSTWSDISELKRHANELERANRDLQEFTYIASHDLKAPLRAISHLSTWLEEDLQGSLSEESAKHLEQLQSRVVRMDKLLSDLLEYSRAGRVLGEKTVIDLAEVLEEITELNRRNNFTVDCDLEVTQLDGCQVSLETVLRNLVSNALKHHDCESGKVLVENEQFGDDLFFRVCDNGPGISPELHKKAFTMFQTLKPRDDVEGSGMGLAIVKKIVESNGGNIWIEENQPRGTKICFTWPG